jgi:hypothetical protein
MPTPGDGRNSMNTPQISIRPPIGSQILRRPTRGRQRSLSVPMKGSTTTSTSRASSIAVPSAASGMPISPA